MNTLTGHGGDPLCCLREVSDTFSSEPFVCVCLPKLSLPFAYVFFLFFFQLLMSTRDGVVPAQLLSVCLDD